MNNEDLKDTSPNWSSIPPNFVLDVILTSGIILHKLMKLPQHPDDDANNLLRFTSNNKTKTVLLAPSAIAGVEHLPQ